MRLIKILILLVLFSPAWAQAAEADKPAEKPAEKSAEKTAETPPDKILGPAEVSEKMSIVWCDKLAECTSGEEMGPKECRKVLKKSFQDGFKNIPQGQKVEVKSSGLNQCSENIKKDTCDSLKSAQTLPGCEFISMLNRS
jgi:hypothetical protein